MSLHKESSTSKQKLQDSLDKSKFVISAEGNFPKQKNAKLVLNPPVIEWSESNLLKMESFLRYQHFPIILKIFLDAGSKIYYLPFKFFACNLIPGISEQEIISVYDIDYILKNRIKDHQLVRVCDGQQRPLYFVSEGFYLKSLQEITS